jgi:hypothetical protein
VTAGDEIGKYFIFISAHVRLHVLLYGVWLTED